MPHHAADKIGQLRVELLPKLRFLGFLSQLGFFHIGELQNAHIEQRMWNRDTRINPVNTCLFGGGGNLVSQIIEIVLNR